MHFLIAFSTYNPQKSWKDVKKFDNIVFSDIQWLSVFSYFTKKYRFYKYISYTK
jgi:hypothetical protein